MSHEPAHRSERSPGDRRRIARAAIAWFLGLTFVTYGLIKVCGGQFVFRDFQIDSRTVDGPTLVWTFFGWSPIYGRAIGLMELVPGLLLLFRRARTIGAICVAPVAANIALMDFCFGFPAVKWFALLLAVLSVALLATDVPRLRLLLLTDDQVRGLSVPRAEPAAPRAGRSPRARAIARLVALAVGLPVAVFVLNLFLSAVTGGPEQAAIDYAVAHGAPRDGVTVVRWSASSWSGLDREGFVELSVHDADPPRSLVLDIRRPNGFVGWRVVGESAAGR